MNNSENPITTPPGENPKEGNDPILPGRNTPLKPDQNPDPTKPFPGGNEPEKNDPTRIMDPPDKSLNVKGPFGNVSSDLSLIGQFV